MTLLVSGVSVGFSFTLQKVVPESMEGVSEIDDISLEPTPFPTVTYSPTVYKQPHLITVLFAVLSWLCVVSILGLGLCTKKFCRVKHVHLSLRFTLLILKLLSSIRRYFENISGKSAHIMCIAHRVSSARQCYYSKF